VDAWRADVRAAVSLNWVYVMRGFDFSHLTGLLALSLPLGALLTVMVIALRKIHSRHRGDLAIAASGRYGMPIETAARTAEAAAAVAPAVRPGEPLTGEALAGEIGRAEKAGQEVRLPELYLAQARELIVSGRLPQASQLLTQCVRLSAKLDQRYVQANARLEIGDLSRANGDLTSACEHWQMARSLFHELKKLSEFDTADKRMRQSGCPTDWVLNDF
jgi:hypothetical protein